MNKNIDASKFGRLEQNYLGELKTLLSKIIACYNLIKTANINLENDENKIRDFLLYNYLNNNIIRKQLCLTMYLFDPEVPEGKTKGRTDIKIQTQNTFIDTAAYYIIECKRLNNKALKGISGLNAEYIKNGMCRFVNEYYPSYYKANIMLGFIVERLDIGNNVFNINKLLRDSFQQANTLTPLKRDNFICNYKHIYYSDHYTCSKQKLTLFHLMLDFSDKINLVSE